MGRCSLLTFLTDRENPNDRDVAYLRSELSCTNGYRKTVAELHRPDIKLIVRPYPCSPSTPERQLFFHDITTGNAITTLALGGFMNINVQQLMLCRHRVRLDYPYLQLIASKTPSGQIEFFAMELIDVVSN
uniref:Uncharacterized protein n=1 Tax=Panagrolaimus davidi TaxID=227884 RepID=A0A914PJQ4_9BILA